MLGSFALLSCNQPEEKTTVKEEITEQTTPAAEENTKIIALNNGEKWVVNEEMKPHVLEGETLVDKYATTNTSDFKTLAADLKSHNDKLIKSCTMTGKSHDELHNWLEPHLKLTKALEQAKDEIEAKSVVTQLQNSYKSYHQYFN